MDVVPESVHGVTLGKQDAAVAIVMLEPVLVLAAGGLYRPSSSTVAAMLFDGPVALLEPLPGGRQEQDARGDVDEERVGD